MDEKKRKESGASEVIGAVLIVSLVVIGGAVVAAIVFGQPTPQEVPHVSFGVSLDDENLTLHHTGGDTLQPDEYNVYVYYTDGTSFKAPASDTGIIWSSDGDMKIHNVTKPVGNVILSYLDDSGGETVLRRVPFEDQISPDLAGSISGHKYEVKADKQNQILRPVSNVTIIISKKTGSTYQEVGRVPTDGDGYYTLTLPANLWGTYKAEEDLGTLPPGWAVAKPHDGWSHFEVSMDAPSAVVDFKNYQVPTPTETPVVTLTETVTVIATPTPTPIPMTSISGHKLRVDATGADQGSPPIVTIRLERLEGNKWVFVDDVQTDASGYYSFEVPMDDSTYRLTESGLETKYWTYYSPSNGVIEGVAAGATDQDFMNEQVPADGVVMFLNKTVNQSCPGGYVVDGTTLEGEARASNKVSFMIGGEEQTYNFNNGEQFRFTIWEDQSVGEVKIEHFEMTSLTFNVKFEVRPKGASTWTTPTNNKFNPTGATVIGIPTGVHIDAINKNLLNEDSTLAYRHPVCSDNQTLLRLNGKVRIESASDDTYLEFTDLHEVHDMRYGEGHNTMWIYLMPGYDYILAQGVCVAP